ncbi:unnamed protein product [Onchocerca flexuosa]|uniref:Transposase n=1 Tax=Onchocerca flexuosa TaxID=387005 RepID=A0A183HTE4_9BILA|nr:unnamed protein product [Onchocerca flexuosa]
MKTVLWKVVLARKKFKHIRKTSILKALKMLITQTHLLATVSHLRVMLPIQKKI